MCGSTSLSCCSKRAVDCILPHRGLAVGGASARIYIHIASLTPLSNHFSSTVGLIWIVCRWQSEWIADTSEVFELGRQIYPSNLWTIQTRWTRPQNRWEALRSADCNLQDLPCYLSNTYQILPLLLNFIREQDFVKKVFVKGITCCHGNPIFEALFSQNLTFLIFLSFN